MADLVKEFNNLDKTEDDLLLEKTEIYDSDGELTSEGKKLLMQLLSKDNRNKLLSAAKRIDSARKKAGAMPTNVINEVEK